MNTNISPDLRDDVARSNLHGNMETILSDYIISPEQIASLRHVLKENFEKGLQSQARLLYVYKLMTMLEVGGELLKNLNLDGMVQGLKDEVNEVENNLDNLIGNRAKEVRDRLEQFIEDFKRVKAMIEERTKCISSVVEALGKSEDVTELQTLQNEIDQRFGRIDAVISELTNIQQNKDFIQVCSLIKDGR